MASLAFFSQRCLDYFISYLRKSALCLWYPVLLYRSFRYFSSFFNDGIFLYLDLMQLRPCKSISSTAVLSKLCEEGWPAFSVFFSTKISCFLCFKSSSCFFLTFIFTCISASAHRTYIFFRFFSYQATHTPCFGALAVFHSPIL